MIETVFPDAQNLADAAAELFAERLAGKTASFRVALSGGSTPRLMYQSLRARDLDWSRVNWYWSDERNVPPEHPESNAGLAVRELVSQVESPGPCHFMAVSGDAAADAEAYDRLLRRDELDLVFLGMGADGHTASLFPGDPSLLVRDRRVVASRAPVGIAERITMTFPGLIAAREVVVLVAGADKAPAWEAIAMGEMLPLGQLLAFRPDLRILRTA